MSEILDHSPSELQEAYQDEKQKTLSKIGEQLLIRISSTLKTAQVFEPNNITLIQQLNILYASLEGILAKEAEAVIQITKNTLFFNSVRIKFDFSTFAHFKLMREEFNAKQIGTVNFDPALDKEQLKEFIILFAKARLDKRRPFEDFQAKLRNAGINLISVEKMHPFDMGSGIQVESVKKEAKKVFFKSISHLKDVFERDKQNKRIRIKTTRRLMQTIVNIIVDNEPFMLGLTNLKNYDEYTLNHSINVCVLSICLGRRLGLDRKELIELGIAAFFHDIGKLEIPEEILNKPGKLTAEERAVIEKHPYLGAGKLIHLRDFGNLPVKALYVALEHHLKADLTGYPRAWKKDSIDVYSRIVEICDFFDAVTTKRPYRKKTFTRYEALQMMLEKTGEEFDPLILKVFANMIGAFPIGTIVMLNTDELAIVVENNPDMKYKLRPKVKLIADAQGNKIAGRTVDLTDLDDATNNFIRSIVRPIDPEVTDINVADYFLSEGEGRVIASPPSSPAHTQS